MENSYSNWHHPYKIAKEFNKKTAYFSMEFAIDQGLKTYSGGLGFLSGSHMRSAYDLKQNLIGVGMLWKYGYYDQGRNPDQTLQVNFIEKNYHFLEDSGLEVEVSIHDNTSVKVRAYVLKPEVFNTAPIYFLTTDVEGNDYLSRTITNNLYDANEVTRVSQSIVLGIGGAKIVEALGGADVYHLNEGHALPAFYHLRNSKSKAKRVFTTHTPEKGGNEERNGQYLNECGFFGKTLSLDELQEEVIDGHSVNYTVAALKHSKKANAVSKLHAKVSRNMWNGFDNAKKIIPITNAQNQGFWQDNGIEQTWKKRDVKKFKKQKGQLKEELFKEVVHQTGKIFDPEILTIVWARRFAGYKRADLLLYDADRFIKLISNQDQPVQIIWAGKPYPQDQYALETFNKLVRYTKNIPNLAVLTGYEIALSRKLKAGSDIWINTPRIPHEASGTSGMTAAMNGSINLSTNDGWIPEFAKNEENCFVLPEIGGTFSEQDQDLMDSKNLYKLLEMKVLPTFYTNYEKWVEIAFNAIDDVVPEFTSHRMARQYYEELY